MAQPEHYAIAVIGGATAGAEAAGIFSKHDILTVVFEQNARPYGKVEDGLPRWHVALRNKEYKTIDEKLTAPHVHFVPSTRIGEHVGLEDLTEGWGFHAVVLANGAWRDRLLPIEGSDAYVGKGLVYQNPFIYWFNHYNEGSYEDEQYEILDGTLVIGGGLASIDVAKVIQLELCVRALAQRGIEVDLVETEVAGIPKTLAKHGLTWEELGIEGCTLLYRRRPEDMPMVELPDDANDKVKERVAKARARILGKAMDKYLFKFEPLHAPSELIVEDDRVVGLVCDRTKVVDGRARPTGESVELRGPMVISSIGSVPAPIRGIDMNGELYGFDDWDLGRIDAHPTLFGVGNVVTGKGNIVASRKHARSVASRVTEDSLALVAQVRKLEPLDAAVREDLLRRVSEQQQRAGYGGDYTAWIESVTPEDRI
jgi:NADPH-dependent glutamate synthase beta subunit-like oxidoreductase